MRFGMRLMKHFTGAGVLVALALVVRFWAFQRVGLDIYVHDTYRVIPLRLVGFWLLMGTAETWLSVVVYKRRHGS